MFLAALNFNIMKRCRCLPKGDFVSTVNDVDSASTVWYRLLAFHRFDGGLQDLYLLPLTTSLVSEVQIVVPAHDVGWWRNR
jgi:hypothetical protein